MTFKFDYKKIFHHITVFFGRKQFDLLKTPRRDWKVIVIGFTILNLISISFSAYIFWRINRGDIFTAKTTSSAKLQTVNKSDLQAVLTKFDDKQKAFDVLKTARPLTVDPSK